MALLKGQQPAARRVRGLLEAAAKGEGKLVMNIVNVGEVFYLSVKARNEVYGERVLESLRRVIRTESASDELVMLAASLKSRHAVSYADAFAAATAILLGALLVTGDPELRVVATKEEKLGMEWIGD